MCINGTAAQRAAVRALHSAGATRDPSLPLMADTNTQLQLGGLEGENTHGPTETGHRSASDYAIPADVRPELHKRLCICDYCKEAGTGAYASRGRNQR